MCNCINEIQMENEEMLGMVCDCETGESDFEDIDEEFISHNEDEDEEEADGDERLTIDELYGYEDPEDNAEAALDDVLKAQENS